MGLLRDVGERWGRLPTNKRLALVVVVVGIIGSLALWAFVSAQVPYADAFSNLKPADGAAVMNKLQELQIPYQIGSGGTIRVPANLVNEARVRVAGAGVLRDGQVGYEIFNQPSFGLSSFIQQVDYQRALEGEIARSIQEIGGVESARVHLAIPQPSVFVSQQREPSAAVLVGLKPGYQLEPAQARAIVGLVVGAVDGMKASNVALLDTRGRLLNPGGDPNGDPNAGNGYSTTGVTGRYAAQRALEKDLETRVQNLLNQVVGSDHANVQVHVQLDWNKRETTSEIYNPDNQLPQVKTSQDLKEVQSTAGSTAGGVPGVTSNVPTYQQSTPTTTGSPNEKTQSSRTYALSQTVKKTVGTPGGVQRVTVAVAVDAARANPALVSDLTKMVQGAVGFDAGRGDVVTVVAVPFQAGVPSKPNGVPVVSNQERLWSQARTVAPIVGPLLAVLALAFVLLRRRSGERAAVTRILTVPQVGAPAQQTAAEPVGEVPRASIRGQMSAIAGQDPALIASILQSWVKEDRGARR